MSQLIYKTLFYPKKSTKSKNQSHHKVNFLQNFIGQSAVGKLTLSYILESQITGNFYYFQEKVS